MSLDALNTPLSRRRFLQWAVATAGGALLASCAPAPAPKAAEEEAPAEATSAESTSAEVASSEVKKLTISMWAHVENSCTFYSERGELWKKEHPELDVTFDFQTVPYDELFTKVLGNLAAGSGAPDIVAIEIGAFCRFMKGEIADKGLVDLTEWIGDEREKFVEGKWTPYIHKGRIYGIESGLCPCGFWYQPAVFEAVGLEEPPKTWEDFVAAGKEFATQGKFISLVGDMSWATFMMLFMQRGGNLFAEDGSVVLDTPEAIEVLQMLVDGTNRDKIFYAAGADDYWGPATWEAFRTGSVAGVFGADWYGGNVMKPGLEDMEGKWRLAPMPLWPKGHKSSTWGGTAWSITKQSKHADIVYDLIHFAQMTLEGQVRRFEVQSYFPTMYEAMKDPKVADVPDPYFGDQKLGALFAEMATDMPIQWQSPYWEESLTELTNQITLAHTGEQSAEQAIKAADANIKAIVAKGD